MILAYVVVAVHDVGSDVVVELELAVNETCKDEAQKSPGHHAPGDVDCGGEEREVEQSSFLDERPKGEDSRAPQRVGEDDEFDLQDGDGVVDEGLRDDEDDEDNPDAVEHFATVHHHPCDAVGREQRELLAVGRAHQVVQDEWAQDDALSNEEVTEAAGQRHNSYVEHTVPANMLLFILALHRGPRLRPCRDSTEAIITAGVEAFAAASAPSEAAAALQSIYDALPHDDMDLVTMSTVSNEFKVEAFKGLVNDNDIWTPDNVAFFKQIRSELDPLRTVDLAGYLKYGSLIGGLYYLAALAVQWFLPEIFPAFYVFVAGLFAAPFVVTFLLGF